MIKSLFNFFYFFIQKLFPQGSVLHSCFRACSQTVIRDKINMDEVALGALRKANCGGVLKAYWGFIKGCFWSPICLAHAFELEVLGVIKALEYAKKFNWTIFGWEVTILIGFFSSESFHKSSSVFVFHMVFMPKFYWFYCFPSFSHFSWREYSCRCFYLRWWCLLLWILGLFHLFIYYFLSF